MSEANNEREQNNEFTTDDVDVEDETLDALDLSRDRFVEVVRETRAENRIQSLAAESDNDEIRRVFEQARDHGLDATDAADFVEEVVA
jgi:hypothetical protein